MTIFSVILELGGFLSLIGSDYQHIPGFYAGMMLLGIALENISIPLWISGGVKRGNNKRAMKEME